MRILLRAIVFASVPTLAFAQQATASKNSPFITAVITWLPVIALIGLWWWFMRKMGGKKGYAGYMLSSQERLESIDQSLKQIAQSLERLAANSTNSSSKPGA
jgi:ATP-dependent Zn protease